MKLGSDKHEQASTPIPNKLHQLGDSVKAASRRDFSRCIAGIGRFHLGVPSPVGRSSSDPASRFQIGEAIRDFQCC